MGVELPEVPIHSKTERVIYFLRDLFAPFCSYTSMVSIPTFFKARRCWLGI